MLVRVSTSTDSSRPSCSEVESVSISMRRVEMARSVSHLESRVEASGARLATCLAPGLHSGVDTELFAHMLGDDKTNSEGPDFLGLGVFAAL